MNDNIFDLYVSCLLSSFGSATAAGLSAVPEQQISHDRITRMLSGREKTSADLRHTVKPPVRRIESPDGVLIVDGSISEKPFTDENTVVCRHYDRCQGRSVRGINFMTPLYHSQNTSLPAGFQIAAETEYYTDPKDGKEKRRCPVPKNRYCRELIKQAAVNQILFRYVLTDVWFASAENMMFIRHDAEKDSVMPVKTDRKTAPSYDDRRRNAECYHKPLRQNVSPEKSPAQTVTTQKNHFSASLCGYVKPEMLKISNSLNHFALKTKIYISSLQSAYAELQKLQPLKIFA